MATIKHTLLLGQLMVMVLLMSANPTNAQAADIVFVVDSSVSHWQSQVDNSTLNLLIDIVSAFDVGLNPGQTRIGVVALQDGKLQNVFKLQVHTSVESLKETVNAMHQARTPRHGGSKSTQRAVASMFESHNGGRAEVPHVVVAIANGRADNDSSTAIIAMVKLIEKSDAVLTVSVNEETINSELMEAASNTGLYFVMNGNDTDILNAMKLDFIRSLIEVCSRHYYDVTIAYDGIASSAEEKETRRQQLETITSRLQNSSCYAHIRVISGSEPSGKSSSVMSPSRERKRPGVRATIRKWRKGLLTRQRRASEGGPAGLPLNFDIDDQGKRLVLMLSNKHEPEFRSIVSELRVVMGDSMKVLLVLDGAVKPSFVLAWQQVLDFSRVIVNRNATVDASEEIENFICGL